MYKKDAQAHECSDGRGYLGREGGRSIGAFKVGHWPMRDKHFCLDRSPWRPIFGTEKGDAS
jgi:hypothetical protein